jgi:hypothetical protein
VTVQTKFERRFRRCREDEQRDFSTAARLPPLRSVISEDCKNPTGTGIGAASMRRAGERLPPDRRSGNRSACCDLRHGVEKLEAFQAKRTA